MSPKGKCFLRETLSLDVIETHLLGGRVRLRQPGQGYRASGDAVLLAAAAEPYHGAKVFDMGCGVGSAALCLLARRSDLYLVGLEQQQFLASLAEQNAVLNAVSERFSCLCGDGAAPPSVLQELSFDWAISNPPFFRAESGGGSPFDSKRQGHQESSLDLSGWLDLLLRRLKPGGGLTLIHRADRLPGLLAGLEGRTGAVTILPLWPKRGEPANRVLVSALKGRRSPARLLPGLVLHHDDGTFTQEAQAVLRLAQALPMRSGGGLRP